MRMAFIVNEGADQAHDGAWRTKRPTHQAPYPARSTSFRRRTPCRHLKSYLPQKFVLSFRAGFFILALMFVVVSHRSFTVKRLNCLTVTSTTAGDVEVFMPVVCGWARKASRSSQKAGVYCC